MTSGSFLPFSKFQFPCKGLQRSPTFMILLCDDLNITSSSVSLLGHSNFQTLIHFILAGTPSLQTRKLNLSEGTRPAQGHTASKGKAWTSIQRCPSSLHAQYTHSEVLVATRDPELMFWGQGIIRNMCPLLGSPDRRGKHVSVQCKEYSN